MDIVVDIVVEEWLEGADVWDNCLYIEELHLWDRQSKHIQNSKNTQNYLLLPDSESTFIILFFRFFYPTDGEFRTYNEFGIDSVEVKGGCCFVIGANDDYETVVYPENPRVVFDTIFYIPT